jgi:hypothetical protein
MLAIAPSLLNAIIPLLYLGNSRLAIAPLLCLGNPILAIAPFPTSDRSFTLPGKPNTCDRAFSPKYDRSLLCIENLMLAIAPSLQNMIAPYCALKT